MLIVTVAEIRQNYIPVLLCIQGETSDRTDHATGDFDQLAEAEHAARAWASETGTEFRPFAYNLSDVANEIALVKDIRKIRGLGYADALREARAVMRLIP